MSGGHFNYEQHRADEFLRVLIDDKDVRERFH